MSELERVTVNLIPLASRALEGATRLTSCNKTDTINRALQIYEFMLREIAGGGEILIRHDGDIERLTFL